MTLLGHLTKQKTSKWAKNRSLNPPPKGRARGRRPPAFGLRHSHLQPSLVAELRGESEEPPGTAGKDPGQKRRPGTRAPHTPTPTSCV